MDRAGWVVVIDGQPSKPGPPVEEWRLRRLLEKLPGPMPVGLHGKDRIALQVRIKGTDEVGALHVALSGLRAALPKVGLRNLRVVRAEVLSEDEFDRDCHRAYSKRSAERCRHCGQAGPDAEDRPRLKAVEE